MGILKKNWTISSITSIILLLGVFFVVEAMEKEEAKGDGASLRKIVNVTWYFNEIVDSDPTNPANYSLEPKFDCGDLNEKICSISAPANSSSQPDMTHEVSPDVTVEDQIISAMSGSTATTNATVTAIRSNQ